MKAGDLVSICADTTGVGHSVNGSRGRFFLP